MQGTNKVHNQKQCTTIGRTPWVQFFALTGTPCMAGGFPRDASLAWFMLDPYNRSAARLRAYSNTAQET